MAYINESIEIMPFMSYQPKCSSDHQYCFNNCSIKIILSLSCDFYEFRFQLLDSWSQWAVQKFSSCVNLKPSQNHWVNFVSKLESHIWLVLLDCLHNLFLLPIVQCLCWNDPDVFLLVQNLAVGNECLNDLFQITQSSRVDQSFQEVVCNLMVLLGSERCNDFSLLVSLDGGIFKEFSDQWLCRDDLAEVSYVLKNNIECLEFGCWGEQGSCVSSWGAISDGWGFVACDRFDGLDSEEELGEVREFIQHYLLFLI